MKSFLLLRLHILFIAALFAFCSNAIAQGPVSSGLIAHYCFDGNADDAVGTKHCTVYGASLTTDRLGRANRAYSFDGVNDYIQMPSDVWFSGDFSVSGWLRVDSYKGFGRFYEFGRGAPGDNIVYSPTPTGWSTTNDAFVIRRNTCTSAAEESANAGPFPYSTWVHVVTVFKGLTGTVWRNGVDVTIATTGFGAAPCSVLRINNYFGKSAWSHDAYFHGKMDDVRIYDRALSAAEIDTLYKLDMTCLPCDVFTAGFKDSMVLCNSYQFTDTTKIGSMGIKSWDWDFGDGTKSSIAKPTHTYTATGSYTITLIVNDSTGCADTATKNIVVSEAAFANAGLDQTLCIGALGYAATTLSASGGVTYSWSPSTGLDSPNAARTKAIITAKTTYILTVTNAIGCIDKDTVVLNVKDHITLTLTPDTVISCLEAENFLNVSGAENYSWLPIEGLNNPLISNPILKPINGGYYVVTGIDANGCSAKDSVFVIVQQNPIVKATPKDTIVCINSEVQLSAAGAITYSWKPSIGLDFEDIPNPKAIIDSSKTYVVRGANSNGCVAYDTVVINTFIPNNVHIVATNKTINCKQKSTTLNAYGAANYEWLPAAYCETPNNATTVVYPRSNQQFLVLGTDANGCVAKDSILIINDGASVVTFPNVFTPNNDGINDYFKVLYTCNFNFKELKIFNRWGQEVFVSGDQNKGWDGNSKGKESELAVYYYLLKGTNDNGKEVLLKGDISLLR